MSLRLNMVATMVVDVTWLLAVSPEPILDTQKRYVWLYQSYYSSCTSPFCLCQTCVDMRGRNRALLGTV